jgi:hypothetical protein
LSADHDHTPLAAFARRVLVAIALAALAFLLWRAVDILFLVLGGVVAAVLLRACAEPVARRTPLSDRQAVVATAIVIVLVLVLVGWLVGAQLSAQISDLLDRLPQAWQGLQDRLGVGALGEWLRGQAGAAGSGTGGVLASLVGYPQLFTGVNDAAGKGQPRTWRAVAPGGAVIGARGFRGRARSGHTAPPLRAVSRPGWPGA